MAPHLCDSMHDDQPGPQEPAFDDRPRYRQSLRRQRRSKKNRAELEDQQDGQSRISDPILPGMDRLSRVVERNGTLDGLSTVMALSSVPRSARLQKTSGMTLKG